MANKNPPPEHNTSGAKPKYQERVYLVSIETITKLFTNVHTENRSNGSDIDKNNTIGSGQSCVNGPDKTVRREVTAVDRPDDKTIGDRRV